MNTHLVRNIWGVGRNYVDHAKELGNEIPKTPLIFLKSGSTIQPDKNELVFPDWLEELHYEVEIAIQFSDQLEFYRAFLAVDFTERSLQSILKKSGKPWALAKSFPGASALSAPLPFSNLNELNNLNFELAVNGVVQQQGHPSNMVFNFKDLMTYVKSHFPVCPGDLLFTGTPAGVGPINNKDKLEIRCDSGVEQCWKIIRPEFRRNNGI